MTRYYEVPVRLRFAIRDGKPFGYDEVRHRLQMCRMDGLAEYVIDCSPSDIRDLADGGEGWVISQKQFENMADLIRPRGLK